jgi:adenosylcobinamide kinase/adenosylcobinamide-phosphate guanylyltransferase
LVPNLGEKMLPNHCFVLGGAASGKSVWAEKFTESHLKPMTYIATGQAFDAEMEDRVKIHKCRRDTRWTTVEAPLDLSETLATATANQVLLIDCATMWLSNHLLAESDLGQAQSILLDGLKNCAAPWVIVSNEVGHGIVPDNKLSRTFREAQGRLNCLLAEQSDLAVMITAGLPQVLKGKLP